MSTDLQEKVKPGLRLGDVPETMLMTLNLRRYDAQQAKPLLGDHWAVETLRRLDFDFDGRMPSPKANAALCVAVCSRALQLDAWTTDFLRRNPKANVVHLACGLDSRCLRLDWNASKEVRWFDVDLPDVAAIRRKVMNAPAGDYSLLAMSALDPDLLAHIPGDRPTLVIAEGLFPYLDQRDIETLVGRIVRHFPGGEICYDASNWLSVWLSRVFHHLGVVSFDIKSTGHNLEKAVSNLQLANTVGHEYASAMASSNWWLWLTLLFLTWAPILRGTATKYRYTF